MVAARSACAGVLTSYMRAAGEGGVATFGWNAFESEKPVYQRRRARGAVGRCMEGMTATGESRSTHFRLWRPVDADCIVQKSRYTLGIIGEDIRG